MDIKTRKALEGSIKKWERIVRNGNAKDKGTDNCLLCEKFYGKWWQVICDKCPVKRKTGSVGCRFTPYDKFVDHMVDVHDQDIDQGYRRVKGCSTCKELAQSELDFLKSLLPEGGQND